MAEDDDSVEETNSGVKKKGSWKKIAEFGEEVEGVIRGSMDEDSVERFDDWRPRVEESERDVKKKTVDEAVINRQGMEEESDGVVEDLKDASDKVGEAGNKAAKRQNPEQEIKDASKDAAKPFYSKLAEFFRAIEHFVYSNIVLKLNPYYLDTQDFSADIKHLKGGRFEMDISVPKEESREELKEGFREDNE